jgi:hypothetical protein
MKTRKFNTDDEAVSFIESCVSNMRPRAMVLKKLREGGYDYQKAVELYNSVLVDLETGDNKELIAGLKYSFSTLLACIDDALERALEQEDSIGYLNLLKLKEKTLCDYSTRFTATQVEESKSTSIEAASVILSNIFGNKE